MLCDLMYAKNEEIFANKKKFAKIEDPSEAMVLNLKACVVQGRSPGGAMPPTNFFQMFKNTCFSTKKNSKFQKWSYLYERCGMC